MPNVTAKVGPREHLSCERLLLLVPVHRVGKQVPRVSRAHDALPGKGKSDAGRVDRDPSTPPLLSHKGSRSTATRWVEDDIAGVRSHQHASLNELRRCLNDI